MQITVLFDTHRPPPADQNYSEFLKSDADDVQFAVARGLEKLGHAVRLFGVFDDLKPLLAELGTNRPELVFNLCEGFRSRSIYEIHIAALLELLGLRYTGSPPMGLMFARDKALTKRVLADHGVRVPHFHVFPRGVTTPRPSDLRFPLIVKPIAEDASVGIAEASVVKDDASLAERVSFIHSRLNQAAIVEELIAGREFYVAVLGNAPPEALPIVEMVFSKEPENSTKIATFKAKWDEKYRKRKGIKNVFPSDIPPEVVAKIHAVCVACYRALHLRDYGRIDCRLAPDNEVYLLEANPNPYIAPGEDFPNAAAKAGLEYVLFLDRILSIAMGREA